MKNPPSDRAVDVYSRIIRSLKEKMMHHDIRLDLESYLLDNFFTPTRREKTIFTEAENLPHSSEFEEDALSQLEEAGWVIIIGSRILPTPLGIKGSQSGTGSINTIDLILDLQNRLAEKTQRALRHEIDHLSVEEIAAVVFLLYNNHTSKERGRIGNKGLDGTIDSLIQAFITGKVGGSTRSLNGRPGGRYFVSANRKLDFKLHLKYPDYYIPWPNIEFTTEKIERSVIKLLKEEDSKFNARKSMDAFEESFTVHMKDFYAQGILFTTKESQNLVRKILRISE